MSQSQPLEASIVGPGHRFDAEGVCIFCDLCDDDWCCPGVSLQCSESQRIKGEVLDAILAKIRAAHGAP